MPWTMFSRPCGDFLERGSQVINIRHRRYMAAHARIPGKQNAIFLNQDGQVVLTVTGSENMVSVSYRRASSAPI